MLPIVQPKRKVKSLPVVSSRSGALRQTAEKASLDVTRSLCPKRRYLAKTIAIGLL